MGMASRIFPCSGLRRKLILERILPRPFLRSPFALLSLMVVATWLVGAILAPMIAPYPYLGQDISKRLIPPNSAHWFGTDPLGRDVLSRVLYGARLSISVGVAAVGLAAVTGVMVGGAA